MCDNSMLRNNMSLSAVGNAFPVCEVALRCPRAQAGLVRVGESAGVADEHVEGVGLAHQVDLRGPVQHRPRSRGRTAALCARTLLEGAGWFSIGAQSGAYSTA